MTTENTSAVESGGAKRVFPLLAVGELDYRCIVRADTGHVVADLRTDYCEARETSAYIVRAVNSHAALVDRLNRSNEFMKQMFDMLTPAQQKKQRQYIELAYQQG